MSINSYSYIDLSFPKGTEYDNDANIASFIEEDGDRLAIYGLEGDGCYIESVLDSVLELFFGKQLDTVPGLEMSMTYECYDDEPWGRSVKINDGKVECSEAFMTWHDCTLDATGVNIGQPLVKDARYALELLDEAPFDDDGRLAHGVYIYKIGNYVEGTSRESILHDIERKTRVSVAWLMGEAKNVDGTND